MAPQWLLPRTAATATFMVRARSIARRIANVAPICPMLLPPSTRMAAAASRATRGRPRGSILPSRSRSAYSGTRSTPWERTPWRSAVTSVSPSKAASSADIPHAAKMPVTTACSRSGGIRRSRSAPGYALTRRSKRDDAASLHAHAEEDDRPGGAGIPETFRLGDLELLLRHAGPGRAEVQECRPAGPGPDDHLARHPLRALVAADDADEPERPRLPEEGGEAARDPPRLRGAVVRDHLDREEARIREDDLGPRLDLQDPGGQEFVERHRRHRLQSVRGAHPGPEPQHGGGHRERQGAPSHRASSRRLRTPPSPAPPTRAWRPRARGPRAGRPCVRSGRSRPRRSAWPATGSAGCGRSGAPGSGETRRPGSPTTCRDLPPGAGGSGARRPAPRRGARGRSSARARSP